MGYSCCIKNCKSEWKRSKDVAFHSFPSNAEFCEKFIAAIPPSLRRKVCKYSKICSKHFTTDCFQPTTSTSVRRILKRDAIPTLFDYDVTNEAVSKSNCSDQSISLSGNMIENQIIQAKSRSTTENLNSGPSTSNTNTVVNEEEPQCTVQPSNVMGKRDIAIQTMREYSNVQKKDVGVQLCDNTLGPSEAVIELRKKVKVLQKRLSRREARLTNMNDTIENLKKDGIRKQQSIEDVLHKHFNGFFLSILKNELQNSSASENRKRYSEEIRSFALTLYSYSPKAYKFVRSKLNLPHDSMLRKWLIKNALKDSDSGPTWEAYMENLANNSREFEPASDAEIENMACSDDSRNSVFTSDVEIENLECLDDSKDTNVEIEIENMRCLDDSRDSGPTTNVEIENIECLDDSRDSGSTTHVEMENMECLDDSRDSGPTTHVEIENMECLDDSRDSGPTTHVEIENMECLVDSRDSGPISQLEIENIACSDYTRESGPISHVEIEIVACSEDSRDSGTNSHVEIENVACSPSSN